MHKINLVNVASECTKFYSVHALGVKSLVFLMMRHSDSKDMDLVLFSFSTNVYSAVPL